jgi:hypothetical protein
MAAALESAPLRAFTARDPLLFLRLVTAYGPVETRVVQFMQQFLERERDDGHLDLRLPAPELARGIVRIADAFWHRHLLGAGEPDLRTAVGLVGLLLA